MRTMLSCRPACGFLPVKLTPNLVVETIESAIQCGERKLKYVFLIRIKQGHTQEEYVEAWKCASEVIQRIPGARGTRLHRAIGDPRTLLAIAEWDSKEARDTAMICLKRDPATRKAIGRHLEFGDFSLVGEFDDADWSVIL